MNIINNDEYRLAETGYGSHRLGNCEFCHKPATELFLLKDKQKHNTYFVHELCAKLYMEKGEIKGGEIK